MNSLISINNKFMEISPKDLIQIILKSKYTKGVEIYVDINNEKELKYLDELTYEIKKYNLILQIHGNSDEPIDKQIEYIKKIEQYSDYLGYPIVITVHSICNEDKEQSKINTIEYISELINNINTNKIILCLENLNDIKEFDRLEKEYITPVVINNEQLFFTYDIGHEIVDYGMITNLNEYMIEEIRNIHIHTHDSKGKDHLPIYKNDKYWNSILKGIIFLINNNYKYNIVYEYDLYECNGNTIQQKILSYLESIDIVSEHYNIN